MKWIIRFLLLMLGMVISLTTWAGTSPTTSTLTRSPSSVMIEPFVMLTTTATSDGKNVAPELLKLNLQAGEYRADAVFHGTTNAAAENRERNSLLGEEILCIHCNEFLRAARNVSLTRRALSLDIRTKPEQCTPSFGRSNL